MKFLAPLALAGLMAATPAAADLTDMDDAEREAFRSEVRAYLLDNPEVLMEAIAVLEQRQAAAEAERDSMGVAANEDAIFNSAFDWVGGNPEGDVVLVEFMDYRCGFCRRANPEVEDLIELDGNIRYIVKEFPILGEQSTLASQFAIATRIVNGDDAYERMHDALITMRGDVNEASLAATANELGSTPRRSSMRWTIRWWRRPSPITATWPRGCRSPARRASSSAIRWCGATCRSTRCSRSWRRCAAT
jgi:protein-disulfide isomerase